MTFLQRITGACLVGLLGSLLSMPAAAQAWQWATAVNPSTTGPFTDYTTASATGISSDGIVFTSYTHTGTMALNGHSSPSTLRGGCVLARHDAAGTPVATLLATTEGRFTDIKFDGADNLYAVGYFNDTLRAGAATWLSTGINDYFLAKWNAAGALLWVKQFAASDTIGGGIGVNVNAAGTVTVAINHTKTVQIEGQSFVEPFNYAVALAQYSAAGTFRWAHGSSAQAGASVFATGVATTPDGTLYVVGSSFSNNLNAFQWGPATIQMTTTKMNYWMKLDTLGNVLQQQAYGDAQFSTSAMTMDESGSLYLTFTRSQSSAPSPSILRWGSASFTLPNGADIGSYVARVSPGGALQWVRTLTLNHDGDLRPWSLCTSPDLTTGGNPRLYIGGTAYTRSPTDSLTCGSLVLPLTTSRSTPFLLTFDGVTGTPTGLAPFATNRVQSNVVMIAANAAGQVVVGGQFTGDTTHFGPIALPNTSIRTAAYTAKLVQNYNLAQGRVFVDANANGTPDASEAGRGSVVVQALPLAPAAPQPLLFSSENSGRYNAVLDRAAYSLRVPNPPRYYTVVAAGPTTASFSTYGNASAGHDFALQPIANQQDLTIHLTPVSRARPGFAVRYRLTVRNVGTVAVSNASLLMQPDPRLTFVSLTPALPGPGPGPAWPVGTLAPGETRSFDALYQLAVTTPLGHALTSTATLDPLNGDLTPADNAETSVLTVTGSYDPNDISVNYATLTLPQVQQATKSLDYTVRFQNMGTDTAFTVTLRDTLPAALLNLGTLQVLASSHSCTWRLGAGGVLTVSFPNIRLPDRTTNTLRSMGFVRFRVVPYTTLVAGDLIPNAAGIYFDFNAPEITNTALTVVVAPSGLGSDNAATLTGGAWPNPATGTLNVAVDLPTSGPLTLSLTDALGRVALTRSAPTSAGPHRETLDVEFLAPGLYLLRATAGGRAFSQRVVVKRDN